MSKLLTATDTNPESPRKSNCRLAASVSSLLRPPLTPCAQNRRSLSLGRRSLQNSRLPPFLLEEEEEVAFVSLGLLRKICHAADHESEPTAPAPATPFRHAYAAAAGCGWLRAAGARVA